jgi:hypothetical protein
MLTRAWRVILPPPPPPITGEYVLTETPGATNTSKMPTHYAEYPSSSYPHTPGGLNYFEVYSPPIKTLYSQVLTPPPPPSSRYCRCFGPPLTPCRFH